VDDIDVLPAAEAICEAIGEHRRLGFMYQGYERIVNPIRFGRSVRGAWQLRATQVGGESRSSHFGSPSKLFDLAEMSDVAVLDAQFRPPIQRGREDDAFAEVAAEV
jgi:hypothetical protein